MLGGQYRIVEVVGHGGMGAVYRARQVSVSRDVAVKILRPELAEDEDIVRRFENEAAAVSRLRHPNTVRFYDYQTTDSGELFIVTELLSGAPLTHYLAGGALDLDRTLNVVDQVCASLAEAHGAGVIHRDIKPENIFIDRVGDEDVVKVLDFGIAKLGEATGDISAPGRIVGTPAYMSPEQVRGEPIDLRSDIYALGVTLYQMLTLRTPFVGDTPIAVCFKHLNEAPQPMTMVAPWADIPAPLEALVLQMLSKDPDDRPASMSDVRRGLAEAAPEAFGSHLASAAYEETKPSITSMVPYVPAPLALPSPVRSSMPPLQATVSYSDAMTHVFASTGHGVRWRMLGALSAALAAVVVSAASFVDHQLNSRQAYSISIGEPAVAADPQHPKVIAELVSEPAGAVVYGRDGERLGTAPLRVRFDVTSAYHLMFPSGRAVIVQLDPTRDADEVIRVQEPSAATEEPRKLPHRRRKARRVSSPVREPAPAPAVEAVKPGFDAPMPVTID